MSEFFISSIHISTPTQGQGGFILLAIDKKDLFEITEGRQ